MNDQKNNNTIRFLLTFFLGWVGSIIINCTDFKPKGYKSRTLAYLFLSSFTFGIYGLVASISNLSFDPRKENNIGYMKEYGYEYSHAQDNASDSSINNSESYNTQPIQSNSFSSLKTTLSKCIVCIMAICSVVTLCFTLCESGYVENGFSFITFKSHIIYANEFTWAIYLIGVLSILFLLISIIQVGLSIFNFFIKKRFNFNLIIIIGSIVIAVLYMIIGIVMVNVCKSTWGSRYYFKTSAYIPLIIQVVLLAGYILVRKLVPEQVSTNKITQQTTYLSNQNNSPTSIVDQIELQLNKYKELVDKGIISQEDYDAKKKQILGI